MVDAALRCLVATGWIPNRLRGLLANFWTKYLNRSWVEGLVWVNQFALDPDTVLAVVNWQWAIGFFDDPCAPHAHVMADPRGVLYAVKCDPDGAFTRAWVPELAAVGTAYIHEPYNAPASLLSAAGVSIPGTYPRPIVAQSPSRERSVDAVVAEYKRCLAAKPGLVKSCLSDFGCTRQAFPLIVEEDLSNLLAQEMIDEKDGWKIALQDDGRNLKVYMRAARDGIKVVLAQVTLPGLSAEHVFDSIVSIPQLLEWDGTFQTITMVEQLDPLNEVVYLVADNPPPPFSRLVDQRDFVIFRHAEIDRKKGVYLHVLRNGESDRCPPKLPYVRGELVGVIGYVIRDLPGVGCKLTLSTASDLKGSIPQYAVNFVAKRTPIKWTDRLKRMVTERYMGHPPVDTKVRIRDWHPT